MFCALLMSRYQVSVYRTNGPLVSYILKIGLYHKFSNYLDICCTGSKIKKRRNEIRII